MPGEEEVSIGLLLPDHSHAMVIKAAELAIDQANRDGGYRGKPFRLHVRTAEGFWGAGSKESVSLVYENQVRAIVGSLDGENGHLAEQVATKTHLAYIECLATEPTLSQAFVPWFTRLVPNDDQQAKAIVAHLRRQSTGKTALLSSENYDTRYAVRSMTKALASAGITPLIIETGRKISEWETLVNKIIESGVEHLILTFGSAGVDRLVTELRKKEPGLHIYGSLHFHMDLEKRAIPLSSYEGSCLIGSSHPWTPKGQILMNEWKDRYGDFPTLRQVYLYDAVKRLIAAIHEVGLDREEISDCLLKGSYDGAATGMIRYDELGNRLDAVTLLEVRNGRLHQL